MLLASRLGLFCVTVGRSLCVRVHRQQSRFYRRYARKLPSSLTRDHSSTLACSASLPVSVCGTDTARLPSRPFSAAQVPFPCGGCRHPRSRSPLGQHGWHYPAAPYQLGRRTSRRGTSPSASGRRSNDATVVQEYRPVVHRSRARARCLGPTKPPRITLAAEPSGLRWWGFAPHFSVTHSGIRTRARSTRACAHASLRARRSPTIAGGWQLEAGGL